MTLDMEPCCYTASPQPVPELDGTWESHVSGRPSMADKTLPGSGTTSFARLLHALV